MTAVEALRKARRTLDCLDRRTVPMDGCAVPAVNPACLESLTHVEWSSLTLDGFSVEEVTAAEHTTEQPHE